MLPSPQRPDIFENCVTKMSDRHQNTLDSEMMVQ